MMNWQSLVRQTAIGGAGSGTVRPLPLYSISLPQLRIHLLHNNSECTCGQNILGLLNNQFGTERARSLGLQHPKHTRCWCTSFFLKQLRKRHRTSLVRLVWLGLSRTDSSLSFWLLLTSSLPWDDVREIWDKVLDPLPDALQSCQSK